MDVRSNKLIQETVWRGAFFSGGWKSSEEVAPVKEPATGNALTEVGIASGRDVAKAALSAKQAQREWERTDYGVRSSILVRAADLAEANSEELIEWLVREAGSIRAKAEFELSITVKALRLAASMTSQPQGHVLPSEFGRISYCKRVPVGVVGVISPFNFPLYLSTRAVAPALAVGNAVVLKPDHRTPVSGGFLLASLLIEAGLPADLLHVLPGHVETGTALCVDPNISMIQFTGSTKTGRLVGELAGRHLKKLSLELGGKNTLIILDDADLEVAASNASWGAYLHQGQICMATGRILVHQRIADEFINALKKRAEQLPYGDPMSGAVALGPIIDANQLSRAQAIIDDAVSKGAKIVAGGTTDGPYMRPTVLVGVTPEMRAFNEEVFAPIAIVTTFKSDDEAAELANSGDYGLSAAVISQSIQRALRLGNEINVGMLHINDQTIADDVVNPIGGRGASGNGSRIGGPANWEEFCEWLWVTIRDEAPRYPM
ncbi:benzaldehyde dehydrogenase [Ensifer sp. Root31]|uniref:benzaldehyde dehydrogenase n=1 Tax=Ensifer sp. Root31 TaxID=1736512 RepID=UPI00070CA061|nr:benzaldehyde dehydrogenase [Ensifer sp. Root31]KQU86376.1 benzaldehyde dehydrogenase [Ensifer sp. Root31]